MGDSYAFNDDVLWIWGQGEGRGEIKEIFKERVTRTLEGSEVTRNADDDDPAYLIEQDDGDEVLKSHRELERVGSEAKG